jgi:hypothetical protein
VCSIAEAAKAASLYKIIVIAKLTEKTSSSLMSAAHTRAPRHPKEETKKRRVLLTYIKKGTASRGQ